MFCHWYNCKNISKNINYLLYIKNVKFKTINIKKNIFFDFCKAPNKNNQYAYKIIYLTVV
jgi:hypothetical protein